MSYVQIGLQIVAMFFLLVTIHEWGHFYFAKRAGVLVREFAIGFGPKLLSYKKGETTYTLRLLPIGGYVRMAGEDPEIVQINPGQTIGIKLDDNEAVTHLYLDQLDQRPHAVLGEVEEIDLERDLFVRLKLGDESVRFSVKPDALMVARGNETQIAPLNRQFIGKTVGQRFMSILAGPVMNVLLAFILFMIYMALSGVATNIKIGSIEPGSAAEAAGLQAGDVIIEVEGEKIGTNRDRLTDLITEHKDQPMTWIIERNGEQRQATVIPRETIQGTVLVGIMLDYVRRDVTLTEAITGAWDNMVFVTEQIFIGFRQLFQKFDMDDLGGPIAIMEISSQYAAAGIGPMVFWTALLSLYLGIFNLLPIPALDGSRLMFLTLEAIRGRPIDPSRESLVHFIGFAMLMLLMIAVTYNDILRLIR